VRRAIYTGHVQVVGDGGGIGWVVCLLSDRRGEWSRVIGHRKVEPGVGEGRGAGGGEGQCRG